MTHNTKKNKPRRNQKTSKEVQQSAVVQSSTLVAARGSSEGEIERLNYFTGQFLEADDFKSEQEYHIRMRRIGNRLLYSGSGVLDGGFQVTSTESKPQSITISSGTGVDTEGRELVIVTPLVWDIPNGLTGTSYVTLEYLEKKTKAEVFTDDKSIVKDYTRWSEAPKVNFNKNKTDINENLQIIIAQITLDSNGEVINQLTRYEERQYPKVKFPGDLTVSGNVGIGTPSPGARLEISGELVANKDEDELIGLKIAPTFNDNGKNKVINYGLVVVGNVSMGYEAKASGDQAIAMGALAQASGKESIAMGFSAIASGEGSIAMGQSTQASNTASLAMGFNTIASGEKSIAIGDSTRASASYALATGIGSVASDVAATAMGKSTASGTYSTAMGQSTASGTHSTAMGAASAFGAYSTAIGNTVFASGSISIAMGYQVGVGDKASQAIAMGSLASANHSNAFIWSDGSIRTSTINDKEFRIRATNGVWIMGKAHTTEGWSAPGTDYAEYFESVNGKSIEIGKTVALDQGKIRVAKKGDTPIGVISANPVILGGSYADWPKKFKRDDYGQVLTEPYQEEVMIPDVDSEGKPVARKTGEFVTKQRPVLNPDYDASKKYIPRSERPEWNCVGLIGQLPVRKGQVVATNWIKIREISPEVELWLIK